jgi:hypothetical protein
MAADHKRQATAGKIATPKVAGGKDVIDSDSILYKAVGARYVQSSQSLSHDLVDNHLSVSMRWISKSNVLPLSTPSGKDTNRRKQASIHGQNRAYTC